MYLLPNFSWRARAERFAAFFFVMVDPNLVQLRQHPATVGRTDRKQTLTVPRPKPLARRGPRGGMALTGRAWEERLTAL